MLSIWHVFIYTGSNDKGIPDVLQFAFCTENFNVHREFMYDETQKEI